MSGNLVQVSKDVSDGTDSALVVTGINTNDVYECHFFVRPVDNDKDLYIRVTTGGVADSDSQYDGNAMFLRADTTFGDTPISNDTKWNPNAAMPNDSEKFINGVLHLFNFNDSGEYSWATEETVGWNDSIDDLVGEQGGLVHTVAEANDGLSFTLESSGNFASGSTVVLYKVV